jgi:predicted ATP-grasp superfamily ATP-dependent carboligase
MNLFIFEHTTGGGTLNQSPPHSLIAEGQLMLDAVISDFGIFEHISIKTIQESKYKRTIADVDTVWVNTQSEFKESWDNLLFDCDGALIIAPESDNTLLDLCLEVSTRRIDSFNCLPEAIALAGDKYQTFKALQNAKIPIVPTYRDIEELPCDTKKIVLKPRDGVGCENTYIFENTNHIDLAIINDDNFIAQPFIHGDTVSVSAIASVSEIKVLTCNRQIMNNKDNLLKFSGCEVAIQTDSFNTLEKITKKIAAAIPGLRGYIGIDFILSENGPYVVDINPRLTTSYAGLHEALGETPATFILSAFNNNKFNTPSIKKSVKINLPL